MVQDHVITLQDPALVLADGEHLIPLIVAPYLSKARKCTKARPNTYKKPSFGTQRCRKILRSGKQARDRIGILKWKSTNRLNFRAGVMALPDTSVNADRSLTPIRKWCRMPCSRFVSS
jgi:hypothetical protein